MAAPQLKKTQGNSASTTLSSGVASGDTSAPLTADTNFAGEGMVVISEGEAVEEFAYATAKAGGALTIPLANRGEEGGSAQTHASGATVKGILTAGMWNDLIDQILVEHDDDGTHDAITATSVNLVSGGSGNVTNTSLFTNALINGNMDVWQRGTSFTASANNDDVYTADRWNLISDGNDAVDITQSTDKPDGSTYSMKLDTETAKRYGVVQFIENKDALKLDNKTVSLSFAAKTTSSQVTTLRAAVLTWGSTADSVTSDVVGTWADTPTWATNWTAENTPADITITDSWATYKVENIAIDTATVNNIAVVIWTPNEETIGDVWYLSQVQLNEGSVALPFQPKSFAQELTDCQRYFEKSFPYTTAPTTTLGDSTYLVIFSDNDNNKSVIVPVEYKVTKRTAATVTLYDLAGNTAKVTTYNAAGSGTNNVSPTAGASPLTDNGTRVTHSGTIAGIGFNWTASAEL